MYWIGTPFRMEVLRIMRIDGIASYDEIDNQLRNIYKEKQEEGLIP